MLNAVVTDTSKTVDDLFARFGAHVFELQPTPDNTPTLWLERNILVDVLAHLKSQFPMLLDLFAIDERLREHKPAAAADFTVVYHLLNFTHCEEIRLKVAVSMDDLSVPTSVSIYPNANWYEREAWDIHIYRNKLVHTLHHAVNIVHTAGVGAGTHGDNPARLQ